MIIASPPNTPPESRHSGSIAGAACDNNSSSSTNGGNLAACVHLLLLGSDTVYTLTPSEETVENTRVFHQKLSDMRRRSVESVIVEDMR